MLAWRTTTTLDFLLKDGNPKRYIDVAQEVRSKMSEEQAAAMSSAAEELAICYSRPKLKTPMATHYINAARPNPAFQATRAKAS
ncbi:hypothetical protein [Rhodoferax sp.]|uniref:hypothetical protein n=1 Tax=Rhodoferax sp. TaxID=50421 RepID=UPI00261E128D|nr:hypothetical protein [Rhodoferax sp.]MDD3937997.1 hypothetical protein [Rhodoferax sp.]